MGKPSKIEPEVTGTIPTEFLPFARHLVTYLTGRSQEPYPNPYQQSLLGAFFGGGQGQQTGQPGVPSQPGIGLPPGFTGQPGLPFERDILPGDLRSMMYGEGRPLFGPAGTGATLGGSQANTVLMNAISRLFPGYAGRAQRGALDAQVEAARQAALRGLGGRAGFGPQLMADLMAGAGWGNLPGGVAELAQMRAESAERMARIRDLEEKLAQGIPISS